MWPGMSILMSRVAGSAGGSATGAAGGRLPALLLILVTLITTTLGGRLSGRLMSARSMVSGAVTFGAVRGPAIDTVPVAVATASSRAATRKFASVADNRQSAPRDLQHDIALRLKAPAGTVAGRKRSQRKAVAIADELGLHVGQHRSRCEVLVARVRELETTVGGRSGDRAAY